MDSEESRGVITVLRERSGVMLGMAGLAAWITLLWFMFGDVL